MNVPSKNVLLIGDTILDCYWYGKVIKICPEAPVPEFLKGDKEDEFRLGGASNVMLNLLNLNNVVKFVTATGNDKYREKFYDLIQYKNEDISDSSSEISDHLVIRDLISSVTNVKIRLVDEDFSLYVYRIALENDSDEVNIDFNHSFEEFLYTISKADIVVVSDYEKGILNEKRIKYMRSSVKGIPLIADPKEKNFGFYKHYDIIIPNHKEVAKFLDVAVKNVLDNPLEYAEKLATVLYVKCCIIKLGRKGLAYYDSVEHKAEIIHSDEQEMFDVSGAGDILLSIIASLWSNYDMHYVLQVANKIAGMSVKVAGNFVVDMNTLKSVMNSI